jgi:hypothetical protein
MRPRSWVTVILGIVLVVMGTIGLAVRGSAGGAIPFLIGASLCYLGWRGGRTAVLVFGHTTIVIGCAMIAWGIYLLPYCKPTLSYVLGYPLFWGLISLFGGICANYHGFCQCIRGPK